MKPVRLHSCDRCKTVPFPKVPEKNKTTPKFSSPPWHFQDYFEASALLDPDPGSRKGRQFAEFLDNKLTEELAFQGSAGHQRTLRSRQLTEQKIQRIDEDVAKAQKKGNTAAAQKEVKAWGLDMTG